MTSASWLANYFSLSPLTSVSGTTSTTTYAYDHNGNLTQSTTAATTTSYTYDYLNRLTGLRTTGDTATTTYAYDAFGSRVFQGNGLATTTYPNKFYSIVSSITGATTTATTTLYAFNGDTLLATIDTPSTTVGATTTTSTSTTRYIHPDHLGSTQATSDTSGHLTSLFDYAPYGSVLVSTSTDAALTGRQYIGQFTDNSGLSYLNARFYSSSRGQFLSQDPVFLAVGNASQLAHFSNQDQKQYLSDPQQLNAYSYGRDNPITQKDPTGNASYIWDSGKVTTGADIWNTNTYYQSQDQATLNANASYGEANRWNLGSFYGQVKNGGPWDYKNNPENRGYYFFDGQLVSAEAFGNLNYGYAGTAFGIGEDLLTDAAGFYQIQSAGRTNRGPTLTNISGNFDDPRDTSNIRAGVSTYNNSSPRPNSSYGYAVVSNAAYNATVRDISRILSAIEAVIKAFSTSKSSK